MSNPNLVRKVSDSPTGGAGEVTAASILSTSNKNKNYIINGDFDIWQRGNMTISAAPWIGYAGDRFQVERSTTLTSINVAKSGVVPTLSESGFKSAYGAVIYPTSSSYTPVGSEFLTMTQKIEGYEFRELLGNVCTLSFWVRSSKIGTYTLCTRNATFDVNNRIHLLKEYTINSANVWEKKVIQIDFSDSFLTTNAFYSLTYDLGIDIMWVLAAGPSRKTSTLNTWHNQGVNTLFASTNQVNLLDNAANEFRISQVQLVVGSYPDVQFTRRSRTIADELMACQRYYTKSGQQQGSEWFPTVATNAGSDSRTIPRTVISTDRAVVNIPFATAMRAIPSVVFWPGRSDTAQTSSRLTVYNSPVLVTFADSVDKTPNGLFGTFQTISTNSEAYTFQFTADAEL